MLADKLVINTAKTVALFISPCLHKLLAELSFTFNSTTVHLFNTAKYLEYHFVVIFASFVSIKPRFFNEFNQCFILRKSYKSIGL